MGVVVLAVLLFLLAAAGYYGKPWVDRHLLLHRGHPKKREAENASLCDDGGVEIVVNDPSTKREVGQPPAPIASALPARLSRQQLGSPLGPMEASIRTALRELRSRQVVKSICSKFESRVATAKAGLLDEKRATTEAGDGECEVKAVKYQSLLGRPEAPKPLDKPQPAVNAPAPRHSVGGTGPAQRSNSLNAFLRRYSSNLEKAVMVTQTPTISSEVDKREEYTKRDDDSKEVDGCHAISRAGSASTMAQPVIMTPCDADSDLEDDYDDLKLEETLNKAAEATSYPPVALLNLRLDIEPIVAIPDDDPSNQCDSQDDDGGSSEGKKQDGVDSLAESKESDNNGHSGSSSPRSRLAQWTASRIPAPASLSLSRSSLQRKLQTPEKASRSVARLQQFRQQVPSSGYAHLE